MFKIYKASAGSGKTTHLVIEYLSLCFKDPRNFRHILAITFTNNATAEMKTRIVNMLYSFAFTPFDQLSFVERLTYSKIAKNAGVTAEAMPSVALDLLRDILYDYDNFSVSTIDSFFQRILRSFALELGLNMNFNVQVSLDEFYAQTIDMLLNRLSTDNAELSQRVLSIVKQKMEESGRWNIEGELLKFLPVIYREESYIPMSKLSQLDAATLNSFFDAAYKKRNELKARVENCARKGNEAIGGRPSSDFIQGGKGVFGFFDKILANPFALPAHAYVTQCMQNGSFTKQSDPALFDVLSDCVNEIETIMPKLAETVQTLKTSRVLLLMLDMKSIMDEIKQRDNLFYLSETNTKLFSEIKDEEAPYIYEKLGNKYSFFFIDEFQDTSKFQWENLMPLVRTALSQPAPYAQHKSETGSAVLFGDVKQAIYRFRNGDASLLNTLSAHSGADQMLYGGLSSIPDDDYKVEPLSRNFRSSSNVISFNNHFFSFLKNNTDSFPLAQEYYDDVEQIIPDSTSQSGNDGFVTVKFKDGTDENYLCSQVYAAIKDAIGRGYEYKDIAVLSRSRAQSITIACALAKRDVPVISSESLLLNTSDKVNLVISALHYIISSNDNLAKFKILNFLIQNKKLNYDLADILLKSGEESCFREQNFVKLLEEAGVAFDRNRLGSYPLFSVIMNICDAFAIKDDNDAFVSAFLSYILDQMPNGDMPITELIDWWDSNSDKLSITSASGVNAVIINTIHSAKGLEYPVLVFPMIKYMSGRGKDFLWCDNSDYANNDSEVPVFLLNNTKDLMGTKFEQIYQHESMLASLDVLNIIYVALTRAARCTYIITGDAGKNSNFAKLMSGFIQSNEIEFCEDKNEPGRYWYGNKDYLPYESKRETVAAAGECDNVASSKLFQSDFLSDDLIVPIDMKTDEQLAGIYVHDFLASLQKFPQNENELAEIVGSAQIEYRERVEKALRTIIGNSKLAPFFAPDVHCLNEISIALPQGDNSKTEVYRPDRIVFFDDNVMVIDYKTGQYYESYEKQLQKYCSLLEQMGYTNVDYKLVFV